MLVKILKRKMIAGREMEPGYIVDTEHMDILPDTEAETLIKQGIAEEVQPKQAKAEKKNKP